MREKGTTISVSLGVTKNQGNFNSLRLDAAIEKTIDVDSVDGIKAAYKELWDIAEGEVSGQLADVED